MHCEVYKEAEGSVGRHADLPHAQENTDRIEGSFIYCLVSL